MSKLDKKKLKKQREIGEAWELFNAAFRGGFAQCRHGDPNLGDPKGTPWQKGVHAGWEWAKSGRFLPKDPMWTHLRCEKMFEDPFRGTP